MGKVVADDGVELAYRVIGDGPLPVLFVHGWMVSGAVFDPLLEVLDTTGLKLVVPDLRGSGRSGKPETGYTLERYARDLLAVAAHEKLGRFVLVGHSMGGQIAQWLAVEHPDAVRGLVLLNAVPASGLALPPDAHALFRNSGGSREMQKTILGLACKQLTPEAGERLLDDAGEVPVACIQGAYDSWTRASFADRLGSVRAPTLAVATDDAFFPPDFVREAITSRIPGARLAVLPGPGHYPHVERPRETAALLQAFLAGAHV